MAITWPEVFLTGDASKYTSQRLAVADALTGWANCYLSGRMGGSELPKKFGEGMAALSEILGGTILPEDLVKLADEIAARKNA